jgi:hypothetical protein
MIIVTRAGIRGLKAHQCVGLPSYSEVGLIVPITTDDQMAPIQQRCNSLKFIDFEGAFDAGASA